LPSALSPLLGSTNRELFEKQLCDQSSQYEKSIMKESHHQINTLLSAKGTGKSIKIHCTYCGMPKGTLWAKAISNSEKIKAHSRYGVTYTGLKISVS